MIHLDKNAKWSALNDKKKAKFAGKEQYQNEVIGALLDWEKLSKDGALFDYTVIEEAFGAFKAEQIFFRQSAMLIVQFKIMDTYTVVKNLTIADAHDSLAL
jgi:hypothetical protein